MRACVYNVCTCFISLNVFLYKIGSSGSSTSRRTTLALRMKPDLQKYVARVSRVFGTFSPLSCPIPSPNPLHSSFSLVQSRSPLSHPHSLHPSFSRFTTFTRSPRSLSSVHTILSFSRQDSRSLPLPSRESVHPTLISRFKESQGSRPEYWIASTVPRGKDPRRLLLESSFSLSATRCLLFPLFRARFRHLRQQRSREGPLARRRENRQFR